MKKHTIGLDSNFRNICCIVVVIQFILTGIYYPVWELFTEVPMLYNNAAYHLYQMKFGRELAEQVRIVGYDPNFVAGYVGGFTINGSAKVVTLIAALLHPWVSEVVVYKIYAYLCDFLGPLFLLGAVRLLKFSNKEILVSMSFGLILCWASWLRWSYSTGMGSSVFSMYLAVFYAALIIRYLEDGGWTMFPFLAGLLAAFLMFFHPHFVLPVALAISAFLLFSWRRLDRRRMVSVMTITPMIGVLPNLPWLFAMKKYGIFEEPWDFQNLVEPWMILTDALGMYHMTWIGGSGAKVYPAIWLGVIAALVMPKDERDKRLVLTCVVTGIGLILLARLGPALDFLKPAELNRFSAPGYLFLMLPAAKGIVRLITLAVNRTSSLARNGIRIALGLSAILGLYGAYEVGREVSWLDVGKYGIKAPQISKMSDDKAWLLDWLRNHADRTGRILFETSNHDKNKSLTSYFSYMTGLQFVGGPIPGRFRFSNPWDGLFFGREIADISPAQFQEYLDLYNIGWIVVHTDQAKVHLAAIPSVRLEGQFQEYTAYQVDRPRSFYYRGQGVVTGSAANTIILDQLEGDEIILKFHYVDGLTAAAPAQLDGVKLLDDPTPFIRIRGATAHLTIQLR